MRILAIALVGLGLAACSSESPADVATQNNTAARCTADEQARRWAKMVTEPIAPGQSVAGVDVRAPITFADLQSALCDGKDLGTDDDANTFHAWGDAQEVTFRYDALAPHNVAFVMLTKGYRGALSFASRPGGHYGQHTYAMTVGEPIRRDGEVFTVNWADELEADARLAELSDGLMATFAPATRADEGTACKGSANCKGEFAGNQAAFTVGPLRLSMTFDNVDGPQPAASSPGMIYFYL